MCQLKDAAEIREGFSSLSGNFAKLWRVCRKKSQFAEWYSHTALAVSFFYSPFQKYCTNLYLLCKLSFWVWRILSNSTISKNVLKKSFIHNVVQGERDGKSLYNKICAKIGQFFSSVLRVEFKSMFRKNGIHIKLVPNGVILFMID